MKFRLFLISAITLFVILGTTPTMAGKPNCDLPEFADHPKCTDDGNTGGDDPIFRADFSGVLTGSVYTRPGTLNGDEKSLQFNPNGPNVIALELDNAFMNHVFNGDEDLCFPPNEDEPAATFSGSVHLEDGLAGTDPDRVAYLWLNAFTRSGVSVQYAIDLFNTGEGWTGPFPPEFDDGIIYRSITRWETRLTKGRYKDGCESGGLISEADGFIDVQLQRVDSNPHY